jgi:1-acyl-sn-glycerol-3-phosphate acyltransferase
VRKKASGSVGAATSPGREESEAIEGTTSKPPKTNGFYDPAHYRSKVREVERFFAQDILLKSTVWTLCKVEVHGVELLDNVTEPFIVVANHSSHFDAPLVFGALPHRLSKNVATGAAADYFFDKKFKGAVTGLFFNAYPIERKGLRTRRGLTGQLLDEGIPLLIFPEGTRSRTGAMAPFKPGVAALSISHNVPVIPVALVGAYAAWPRTRGLPPTNHPEVHVVFGHPLTPMPSETAHAFAQRMRNVIVELYDSTAKAYGMPTLDDYEREAVWREAEAETKPTAKTAKERGTKDRRKSARDRQPTAEPGPAPVPPTQAPSPAADPVANVPTTPDRESVVTTSETSESVAPVAPADAPADAEAPLGATDEHVSFVPSPEHPAPVPPPDDTAPSVDIVDWAAAPVASAAPTATKRHRLFGRKPHA